MFTEIVTDRLLIRPLSMADAPDILRLLNDPDFLKYIGDKGVRDIEDARQYLEEGPIMSYRVNGFGLWAVCLKDTGQFAGICGILKRDHLAHPDLGYALLPEFRRKGFMKESAKAVIEWAKHSKVSPLLYALVQPDNAASMDLLRKCGFTYAYVSNLNEKGGVHVYTRTLHPPDIETSHE